MNNSWGLLILILPPFVFRSLVMRNSSGTSYLIICALLNSSTCFSIIILKDYMYQNTEQSLSCFLECSIDTISSTNTFSWTTKTVTDLTQSNDKRDIRISER